MMNLHKYPFNHMPCFIYLSYWLDRKGKLSGIPSQLSNQRASNYHAQTIHLPRARVTQIYWTFAHISQNSSAVLLIKFLNFTCLLQTYPDKNQTSLLHLCLNPWKSIYIVHHNSKDCLCLPPCYAFFLSDPCSQLPLYPKRKIHTFSME